MPKRNEYQIQAGKKTFDIVPEYNKKGVNWKYSPKANQNYYFGTKEEVLNHFKRTVSKEAKEVEE